MNKNIAIIPARGGSKRIPKKNISLFLGKPIISYSIEAALESDIFAEVMVSTDDEEIAAISLQAGAKIPFLRNKSAASDTATTADALLDVFSSYQAIGMTFEYACCLYPTAPFVNGEKLKNAYNKLIDHNYDAVFPVLKYSYPIWRSLKNENETVIMNWPEHINSRSQDLPEAYHDAGQFYFFKVDKFLKEKTLFGNNSGAILIDEMEGQDIDSLTDWTLAELKYKILHNKSTLL